MPCHAVPLRTRRWSPDVSGPPALNSAIGDQSRAPISQRTQWARASKHAATYLAHPEGAAVSPNVSIMREASAHYHPPAPFPGAGFLPPHVDGPTRKGIGRTHLLTAFSVPARMQCGHGRL